jgi:predicted PurR-regulated permease PerM
VTSIFFLVEETSLPRKVQSVAADEDPNVTRMLQLVKGLRRFMAINAGVGLLFAIINVVVLSIIGVDFAVLWGIFSFMMSFIPGIGLLLSIVPPALMALVQSGVTEMLIVIVAYLVSHSVIYSLIKPLFIQDRLNISITVTFLSLIVWGWILGPIGAILAVPMTIILQAILDSRRETRWMAYLMGTGSEPFARNPEVNQAALE